MRARITAPHARQSTKANKASNYIVSRAMPSGKYSALLENGLHKNGRPPFDHVFRQPCVMGMPPVVCIAQLRPRIGGIAGVNAVQRLIEPKTVRGSCVQRDSELRLGIRDLRIFCRTEKLLRIDPRLRMPLPFT